MKFEKVDRLINKNWNIHDYKNLIAFKTEKDMQDFFNVILKLEEINKLFKPKETGKDYKIEYVVYDKTNYKKIKDDIGNKYFDECYESEIEEYISKDYFMIGFTNQKECYDLVGCLMNMIYHYFNEIEFSYYITNDNIHPIILFEK